MRNYKKIQTEKNIITKIVCNKCKKEITIKNGIPEEEMLTVEKRWGYFSHKVSKHALAWWNYVVCKCGCHVT